MSESGCKGTTIFQTNKTFLRLFSAFNNYFQAALISINSSSPYTLIILYILANSPEIYYLCTMKWLKVLLALGIIVIAILATLHMTKPDRTVHYTALKTAVLEVVSKELNENPALQPYAAMGTMKALEATDDLLSRGLIIHEHTYYNLGLLIYEGQPIPVSVGILGQVHLTADQQDLEKLLKRPDILESIGLKELQKLFSR